MTKRRLLDSVNEQKEQTISQQTQSYFTEFTPEQAERAQEKARQSEDNRRKKYKSAVINIRVTEAEKAKLEAKAEKNGESLSDYVRKILIKEVL